jgi:DNA-binding MarR family transcriptional regulator
MAGKGAATTATGKRAAKGASDDALYETLATFRAGLREFLAFSDRVCAALGMTQQQYQALLALKSHGGPEPLTISGLAALLLIKHHSAVGMVDRLEKQGIVRRETSPHDRRVVALRLTARGARALGKLAAVHRAELRRVAPEFARIFVYLGKPEP